MDDHPLGLPHPYQGHLLMNKNFKNCELKFVSSKQNALMTHDMFANLRHGSQKPNPLSPFVPNSRPSSTRCKQN